MEHSFADAGLAPGEPTPLLNDQDRPGLDEAITTGLQKAAQVALSVVEAVIGRQPFINDAVLIGDQAVPFAKGFKKSFLSLQAHPLDLVRG